MRIDANNIKVGDVLQSMGGSEIKVSKIEDYKEWFLFYDKNDHYIPIKKDGYGNKA